MAEASRLYGMKAVVTGAASGIGEAIARTFVKHGAAVLAADEPGSGIDMVFRRVQGITALTVDSNAPTMAAKLTQAGLDELGGVDILVNNYAGDDLDGGDPVERMLQQIRETSDAVLPLLKQSPAGRIINVGCLQSAFGPDGDATLAACERAIAELTARQAAELGGHGINANYIQPGAIMTPQSRVAFDADKAFRDRCIRSSAARRLGEPLDVAKVALFLASDDAVFVSGTGIAVDGGRVPGLPPDPSALPET
jgi:NAD(P)-dependent dehydrogenase (short-subunit alcohol dehydrogenase family)